MNELVSKIGKVEQLELFPAEEFADIPDETLAEWINTGHTAIKMAVRRLAIHVAQVGAWLVAAKAQCQHGEWLDWLAENCLFIPERTVQRYMEFYNKAISNPSLVADLARMPITEAYRELGSLRGYRPRGYVLRRRANLISHFVISSLDDETWASY